MANLSIAFALLVEVLLFRGEGIPTDTILHMIQGNEMMRSVLMIIMLTTKTCQNGILECRSIFQKKNEHLFTE